MISKPDSLIFDMDGTLWDATDTYLKAWNTAFFHLGMNESLTRERLNYYMGWERRKFLADLFKDKPIKEQDKIADLVEQIQDDLLRTEGGNLYDGVQKGLQALSEKYKLCIVSNCPANVIKLMMKYSQIDHLIADSFAHGENGMPKNHNINLLMKRNHFSSSVYIGDTEGDKIQSELAGVPFVFVSYGFGKAQSELEFDSFELLTNYFLK